jgi:hypothetical protein
MVVSLPMVAAIVAGSAIALIVLYRLRDWYELNLDRIPPTASAILAVAFIVTSVLVVTRRVPADPLITIVLGLSVLAAVWGWFRYQRSPSIQRWEATWRQVDSLLASDPQAADAAILAALKEEDAEREQLRAAAVHNRRAALAFQRQTRAELLAWNRTVRTALHDKSADDGDLAAGQQMFEKRRGKLEADLEWVTALLSDPSGAA